MSDWADFLCPKCGRMKASHYTNGGCICGMTDEEYTEWINRWDKSESCKRYKHLKGLYDTKI